VATGANFPDALSAAAAAALVGGPLLLTPTAALPAKVLEEIKRLAPKHIYVVGGAGAVSESVLHALQPVAPTSRLGGADRYATGLGIVKATFKTSSHAFLATGRTFPDALAATGAAGLLEAPVILVDGTKPTLTAATLGELTRLGVSSVTIAGGTGAVSAGIQAQLANTGFEVARYGGASRYDTAAMINNAYFPAGSTSTMFLATGANFPDALAGAAIAGRLGAPLFVTTTACTPPAIHDAISNLGASKRVVMGGSGVVSAAAAANTGCLTVGTPSISGTPLVTRTLTANTGSWTPGTGFSYRWYANGTAISGASGASLAVSAGMVGKQISVKVTGTQSGYLTASKTSKATAAIGYPSRTAPTGTWTCPSWAPIKGNADSMIYHMPYNRYYDATNPEECFRTESAAVAAGYRKAKV
jgi:putative cell wall-binding protein